MDNTCPIIPGTYAILDSTFGYKTIVYIQSVDSEGFTVRHVVNLSGKVPPDPSFVPHKLVTCGQLRPVTGQMDQEMLHLLYGD
jgi:hypothetical protein